MIEKVRDFNQKNARSMGVYSRALDLVSEMGELSKEVLISTKYGTREFNMTESFKEEYGDVLYALLSFGIERGLDVEGCLDTVIDKYQKRIDEKGSMNSK